METIDVLHELETRLRDRSVDLYNQAEVEVDQQRKRGLHCIGHGLVEAANIVVRSKIELLDQANDIRDEAGESTAT